MKRKTEQEWQWCPFCRGMLDTGWECNDCGADLMRHAYPRWQYWRDKIKQAWQAAKRDARKRK